MLIKKILNPWWIWLLFIVCTAALADGSTVDKVYDPYINSLETEFEYRLLIEDRDEQKNQQQHLFGVGKSISDRIFVEAYAIGESDEDTDFSVNTYELEVKVQLSEQGEYDNDWGLLFELEREIENNIWEASTVLIATRQWSRWVGTVNATVAYEWGSGIDNEVEADISSRFYYRYKPTLEPAFEVFLGEDTIAAGPLLSGTYRFAGAKKLFWNIGVIAGLDSDTADYHFKFDIEYEF